jgi:hypothetical protein
MAFFAFAEGSLAVIFISCVVKSLREDHSRCAALGLAAGLRGSHIIVIVTVAPWCIYILRIQTQLLLLNFKGSTAILIVRVAER